jgi:hypothetical protein
MKKLFTAFLLLFLALAYGTVTGAGPLCGAAYASTMPDGNDDPDGGSGSGGGVLF